MIKITKFIVKRQQDPTYQPPEFLNFSLERKKSIYIEEILKVFMNNSNLMELFLKSVIEAHGDDLSLICKEINPYHKYLECLLHDYSTKLKENTLTGISSVKEEIDRFIKVYEDKVDKIYVLFLFRFYEYYEGFKIFSQQLHMNQELLGLYIEKNQDDKIIQICSEYGFKEKNLWIQALTYFRGRGDEVRIKDCLNRIQGLLSPLLVLEIL